MRVFIGDRGILPATKAITWWVLDQNPLCNEVACYCTKFSNYINYYCIVTFKEYPCFPSDQWLLGRSLIGLVACATEALT